MTQDTAPDPSLHEPTQGQKSSPEALERARPAHRDFVPALYVVGGLVLGATLIWLWQNPIPSPPLLATMDPRLDSMDARITRLEDAPKLVPPDLAPLLSRLAALESRPVKTAPPVDLSGIEARIVELDARPKLSPPDPALAGQVAQLSNRIARYARLQAASTALEAGQRLGAIPDAPAALQRFADTPPPTEAALRLAFPAASHMALAASRPEDAGLPSWERFWRRAQAIVTVRRGDQVLVGDPAAGTIAVARRDLDAGDLAGAVTVLAGLNLPAALAMAGWLSDARALLEARAALAALATQP